MNIDLEKAKQEFIKFTEKFNLQDNNIKRKQLHSLRVMAVSEEIAKRIGLNEEEVKIATLIGLLHDIGRFKQYTEIGLGDVLGEFDHGDYGVEILNKELRKYIQENQYDRIIKKAIKNHNKYEIEEKLEPKELLFARIIRDADKIDIFYEAIEIFWIGIENQINKTKISKDIESQFKSYKQIKRKKENNNIQDVNRIINVISFIFDINFKESFEIIQEQNYVNRIIDRFNFENEETKIKIQEIKNIANEYINEKAKE